MIAQPQAYTKCSGPRHRKRGKLKEEKKLEFMIVNLLREREATKEKIKKLKEICAEFE